MPEGGRLRHEASLANTHIHIHADADAEVEPGLELPGCPAQTFLVSTTPATLLNNHFATMADDDLAQVDGGPRFQ